MFQNVVAGTQTAARLRRHGFSVLTRWVGTPLLFVIVLVLAAVS